MVLGKLQLPGHPSTRSKPAHRREVSAAYDSLSPIKLGALFQVSPPSFRIPTGVTYGSGPRHVEDTQLRDYIYIRIK
jgi:hypothetical protein